MTARARTRVILSLISSAYRVASSALSLANNSRALKTLEFGSVSDPPYQLTASPGHERDTLIGISNDPWSAGSFLFRCFTALLRTVWASSRSVFSRIAERLNNDA